MSALSADGFLEQLVRIPSVSGHERAASEFAVSQMLELGYRTAYVDPAGSAVGVWGTPGAPRRIYLLGHIDTVPGEIPVRVEDGVLFGRGAVDAKGPLATFIQAAARLPKDLDAEIVVLGATEEESATSKGARHAVQSLQPPTFCIIGEPSGTSGITLGYKGRLLMSATVSRPSTHTAHAHESAPEAAIELFRSVQSYVEHANDGVEGIFERLDLSLRSFQTHSNGLEDVAEWMAGLRLGPSMNPCSLEDALRTAVDSSALGPDLQVSTSFRGAEPPVRRDRRNPLAAAFFASIRAHGLEPRTLVKTGTSDMNVVAPHWPGPLCAYGPGDSALDHTPHERLALSEYAQAISILESVLRRLCGLERNTSLGGESKV